MRIAPIMVCASLVSACFATEGLMIGALPDEEAGLSDAGTEAGALKPPELDAATPAQDAEPSTERDASMRPRSEDDGEDQDGGERDDTRAISVDAGLDAGRVADAASDIGLIDSAMPDAGRADSGLNDAGTDAAPRNPLCAIEPWHCL
jgi:hypothetical protein